MRPRIALLSLFVFVVMAVSVAHGQQPSAPAAPITSLKVGDPAPDFTLRDTNNKEVKLSDFKGKKNVVLAFYVFAFTGG